MINIRLRDFRGADRIEIACSPIALIAGRNGAAKTSLAQAVGAALTGNALPVEGVNKSSAGMLVRAGAAHAVVELEGEVGKTMIEWPTCQVTSSGTAPHASKWAAGLDSVVFLAPRERAQILSQYLKAEPTRDDISDGLRDAGLDDPEIVSFLWKLIEAKGWDGAYEARREKGAELKGRWSQATGVRYGSRVAAAWVPTGWHEWRDMTEEQLTADVEVARARYEAALAASAVSAAARQRLEQEAAKIKPREDELTAAEEEERRLSNELVAARNARAALPPAEQGTHMACPHCGGLLRLRQRNLAETYLEKADTLSDAENKRRRHAIALADGDISRLVGEHTAQTKVVAAATQALQAAFDAREQLSMDPPQPSSNDSPVLTALQTRLEDAQRYVRDFAIKATADELREKIKTEKSVVELLAPDGIRGRKMARILNIFNNRLEGLCRSASWKAVMVDPNMMPSYGGRPYPLLSTSECYRVRVVLQVALAQMDESTMVVIDAADVLDGPTRGGLFTLLDTVHEENRIHALVCLTLSRREQMPDLAAVGFGESHWLEAGVVGPVDQAA